MRVKVDDEILHKLKQMIDEGADTEHKGPLPQEAAAVGFGMIEAWGIPGETEEDVEEEQWGEGVKVEHQELDLHLRHSHLRVSEVVDGDGDIDGDDCHAVQTRDSPQEREDTPHRPHGNWLINSECIFLIIYSQTGERRDLWEESDSHWRLTVLLHSLG